MDNNQTNTTHPFTYTITFSVPARIVEPVEEVYEEEEEYWSMSDYVDISGQILAELDKVNTRDNPELLKPTNKAMLRCLDVLSVAATWMHQEAYKKLKK